MGDCSWHRTPDRPSSKLAEYPKFKRVMQLFVGGLVNDLGGMPLGELPSMLTGDPRVCSSPFHHLIMFDEHRNQDSYTNETSTMLQILVQASGQLNGVADSGLLIL